MLLILEGLEGTGKTATGRLLSERWGVPLYRAFRAGDEHWGQGSPNERRVRSFGVDLNSHVEDMYAADLLSVFKVDAILDRSMPSALAYGVAERKLFPEDAEAILAWWLERLSARQHDLLYIQLVASPVDMHRRSGGRLHKDWHGILDHLATIYARVGGSFEAHAISTTAYNLADAAAIITSLAEQKGIIPK